MDLAATTLVQKYIYFFDSGLLTFWFCPTIHTHEARFPTSSILFYNTVLHQSWLVLDSLMFSLNLWQVVPPPVRQGGVMVESVDELLDKLKTEAGVLE